MNRHRGVGQRHLRQPPVLRATVGRSSNAHEAFVLYAEGKLTEALASATQAVEKSRRDIYLLNLIAMCHLRLGDPEQAILYLQNVLRIKPDWAEASSNLGNILKDQKQFDAAESAYRNALLVKPDYAEVYSNLGNLLRDQGRCDESAESYQRALRIKPDNAEAHYNFGMLQYALEQFSEAEESYKSALRIKPDFAEAHFSMGLLLHRMHRFDESAAAYRNCLHIKPDHAEAIHNLRLLKKNEGEESAAASRGSVPSSRDGGDTRNVLNDDEESDSRSVIGRFKNRLDGLKETWKNRSWQWKDRIRQKSFDLYTEGKITQSLAMAKSALILFPGDKAILNLMGVCHQKQGNSEQAVVCWKESLQSNPDYLPAHTNIGLHLMEMGQFAAAELSFRHALRIEPENAEAHFNLGNLLKKTKQYSESLLYFQNALKITPDYPEAHFNLSIVQLLIGKIQDGLLNYEWRWQTDGFDSYRYNKYCNRLWNGEPVANKRLLIWGEQGVGESILFASMFQELITQGALLTVECDKRLIPIYSRTYSEISFIERYDAQYFEMCDKHVDYHAIVCRLARKFRPGFHSHIDRQSYLKVDYTQREILRNRYRKNIEGSLLVGIAWESNKSLHYGTAKSVTLMELQPVLETKGILFVDLQYGDTAEERLNFEKQTGVSIIHDDLVDQMKDLDAFAAQVAAMDMVVTISNTTAHFAGALGIPTLLILGEVPIWYWGASGEKCSWYPSLQLFRSQKSGDWHDVVRDVAKALVDRIA
ncbi:MAG: tetratricopeptide repeat protein [Magnetococcus sp. YQC-3]